MTLICSGSLIGEASGCQPEDCGFKPRPLLQSSSWMNREGKQQVLRYSSEKTIASLHYVAGLIYTRKSGKLAPI